MRIRWMVLVMGCLFLLAAVGFYVGSGLIVVGALFALLAIFLIDLYHWNIDCKAQEVEQAITGPRRIRVVCSDCNGTGKTLVQLVVPVHRGRPRKQKQLLPCLLCEGRGHLEVPCSR